MQRASDETFLDRLARQLGEAGPELALDDLQAVLNTEHPATQRLLSSMSLDGGQRIGRDALLAFVQTLRRGSQREHLRWAFKLHDIDNNGTLQEEELQQILTQSLTQYKVALQDREFAQLSHILFSKCDQDEDDTITFDEFERVLAPHPELRAQMARTAITCLRRDLERDRAPTHHEPLYEKWLDIVKNQPVTVGLILVYICANSFFFWSAVEHYAMLGANISVQIARGCGACINFNGALILLPVMRNLVSWLRRTPLRHVLPIDENIAFHKLIGHVMFGLCLVHTLAHLHNYSTVPGTILSSLTGTQAGLSGLVLLIVFGFIWVFALDFVRKRGAFELFFFTHVLFVLWFILMLIHGPVFWKWALLPGSMFLVEMLIRARRIKAEIPVLSMSVLSSGVTRLTVERPSEFEYSSGDYLFVRYPRLAKHEWHPFTITSCPEQADILEMHIRSRGNWTHHLHMLARSAPDLRAEPLSVSLDGPFGTPSTHIYEATNAVLIGAGIGVTPFASILKSIHHQRQLPSGRSLSLDKIHFFWLNRSHRAFEWFTELLSTLEEDNDDGFLSVNIFLTGVKEDARASLLDVAMMLYHQETGRDLLTGLAQPTTLGRPSWDATFQQLATEHAGEPVDVFFCGPLKLGRTLKRLSHRHGFDFHMEQF